MSDLLTMIRQSLDGFSAVLDDAAVIELSANSNGRVFVERLGEAPSHAGDLPLLAREQVVRLCATAAGVPVTAAAPIVSAKLPGLGYRVEALIPPAVAAPAFSIRFHNARVRGLESCVADGTMTAPQAALLRAAIAARRNIVVAGGTSSGKTTLLNTLMKELGRIAPADRVIVIEDTPEIKSEMENVEFLRVSPAADAIRLLASTLRLRPDRIMVGEVRDGAALALLKSWNTGHPGGLTSVHANSAVDALIRLDLLVREVSAQPLPEVIGAVVDLIVSVTKTKRGRQVQEIIQVKGYVDGRFVTEAVA